MLGKSKHSCSLASFPSLRHSYLLFAVTIMHGSRRALKNRFRVLLWMQSCKRTYVWTRLWSCNVEIGMPWTHWKYIHNTQMVFDAVFPSAGRYPTSVQYCPSQPNLLLAAHSSSPPPPHSKTVRQTRYSKFTSHCQVFWYHIIHNAWLIPITPKI